MHTCGHHEWRDTMPPLTHFQDEGYDASASALLQCPVCLDKRKAVVFQCGHQTCCGCASLVSSCPICRQRITTRIRVYY